MIGAFKAETLLTEYLALIGVTTSKGDSMQQTAKGNCAIIMNYEAKTMHEGRVICI